jgi:hypothetical protein
MTLAEACELHPAINSPPAPTRIFLSPPISSPSSTTNTLSNRHNSPPTPIMPPKDHLTPRSTPDPKETNSMERTLVPLSHLESAQTELPFHVLFAPSPSRSGQNASNSKSLSHPVRDASETASSNTYGQVAPVAQMLGYSARVKTGPSEPATRHALSLREPAVQDSLESDNNGVNEKINAISFVNNNTTDGVEMDIKCPEVSRIASSSASPVRTILATPVTVSCALPSPTGSHQTFPPHEEVIALTQPSTVLSALPKSKKRFIQHEPNVTTRAKRQKPNNRKNYIQDEILDSIKLSNNTSTPIRVSPRTLRDAVHPGLSLTALPPKYIVQRLLRKRVFNKKVWYLVAWKGYPKSQATWELEKQIRQDIQEGETEEGAVAAWKALKATLPSRRR